VIYKPLPQDDPRQRQPDISLASSMLGWEPKVGLEDGLKETVEYFRKIL
jgi:UDP-glucuronate decarboxylase